MPSECPPSRTCLLASHARDVHRVCRQFAIRQASILCSLSVEPDAFEQLCPDLDVTSVLAAGANQVAGTARDRTGTYDPVKRAWILPRRMAPVLIVLDAPTHLPSALSASLLRRGVRRIVIKSGTQWVQQGLVRLLARAAVRSGGIATLGLIERIDERLAARAESGRNDLVTRAPRLALRAARHGLERMRPTRHYRGLEPDHLDRLSGAIGGEREWVEKRILMFNSALSWGGAERQLVNTLKGLRHHGFDASLLCDQFGDVPDSDFFAHELEPLGIAVEPLYAAAAGSDAVRDGHAELKARIEALPPPFATRLWPYLAAILSLRPSVVHTWQDQTNVMAGTAAVIAGVPRVVLGTRNLSAPNFSYHLPHMRQSYRTLLRCNRVRLLNNSRAGAADYAAWLDVPEEGLSVLYNGLALSEQDGSMDAGRRLRQRLGIPPEAPVVGSIFRFFPEKDPFLWLKCAEHIATTLPETHFLLVGAGPLEPDIRRYAKRAGIDKRLVLAGTMRDPGAALAAMNIFLLTSRFEGLPNVLIEAQAAGVPVVSTRAGGSGETFRDGVTGWLVSERVPAAIAERVCQILRDSEWAAHASRTAPAFVRETFALDRMVEATIALYALGRADLNGARPDS